MNKRYQVPNKPMCPYCDETSYVQFKKGDWWGAEFKCDICDRTFLYCRKKRYASKAKENYRAFYRMARVESALPHGRRGWAKIMPDSVINNQLWYDAIKSLSALEGDKRGFSYQRYIVMMQAKQGLDPSIGSLEWWAYEFVNRGVMKRDIVLAWDTKRLVRGVFETEES